MTDKRAKTVSTTRTRPAAGGARRRRLLPALVAAASCASVCALMLMGALFSWAETNARVQASPVAASQGGEFARFSHASQSHASQSCASCHRREDNGPAPSTPGHKACTDCHFQQFVTSGTPFCAICHTNVESSNPPVEPFPKLQSFNVKFDHAQHSRGPARPQSGCASCHAPARRGVALSIPAGLSAHTNCYSCHTPGAQSNGRDISSCGTCHTMGRYNRTPTNAKAYGVSFSHAEHGGRERLSCTDCHTVRAGLAQGRQVSSPRPAQHLSSGRAQSCATCHDNRRAFGGEDFSDCKRCHTGATFRF